MPRRSAAAKEKTHERMVRFASRAFRSDGSAVGIADVMKKLGLTHGGFYRHFKSKDDLFVDAIAAAFKQVGDRLEEAARSAGTENAIASLIEAYLSLQHLEHPEAWCPMAALSPEIARMPVALRRRIDAARNAFVERIIPFLKGDDPEQRREQFLLLFTGMIGAVTVLRSFGDLATRDKALELTRNHYLRSFA